MNYEVTFIRQVAGLVSADVCFVPALLVKKYFTHVTRTVQTTE